LKGLEEQKELVRKNKAADIKAKMLDARRQFIDEYRLMHEMKDLPKLEDFYEKDKVGIPPTPEQGKRRMDLFKPERGAKAS